MTSFLDVLLFKTFVFVKKLLRIGFSNIYIFSVKSFRNLKISEELCQYIETKLILKK